MASRSTVRSPVPVRVVLATTTLLSLISSWRAAAIALAELGGLAFFASGVAEGALGASGAWYVLLAVLTGVALRAADIESCGLFVPGGLSGTVREALGKRAGRAAAASELADYLLAGALAAVVAGHYVASLARAFFGTRIEGNVTTDDLSVAIAVFIVGALWVWQRQGRLMTTSLVTRTVTAVFWLLVLVVLWASATAIAAHHFLLPPVLPAAVRMPSILMGRLHA